MSIAHFEPLMRRKYGARYKRVRGKNGPEFRVCCPFCLRRVGKVDTKYKLTMNPDKNVYRCWRCNAKGSLSDFLGAAWENDVPAFVVQAQQAPSTVEPPGTLHRLTELDNDHVAIRYLRRRGYNPAALDEIFGVRYCSEGRSYIHGLFNTSSTIVLPVWMNGVLQGWQARLLYNPDSMTPEECAAMGWARDEEDGEYERPPKYFTPYGVDKGLILFNYDIARQSEIVLVTEGPFDAISCGPCAVATFGKGVTTHQANLLMLYWKLIVILLDPGDADREMQELFCRLANSRRVLKIKLQGYKDPGEAPTEEIWRQIDAEARRQGIALEHYNWGPYWRPDILKRQKGD